MSRFVKPLASFAIVGATLASSAVAHADDQSGVLATRPRDKGTPQNFAMELRGALYQPRVDSDPSLTPGSNPYTKVFGDTPRLELAIELDWQALRIPHVGSLGPGLSAGYTAMNANAPLTNGGGASAEDTSLTIFPFYGVAVFRLDVLARDIGIPLVPYAKAGVGVALWSASNSVGPSYSPDKSVVAKGHTFGTHLAAGLALELDVFDQHAARSLDESTGINHTYLFGEYMISELTGLGQEHALYVGTHSWAFGLAFEF